MPLRNAAIASGGKQKGDYGLSTYKKHRSALCFVASLQGLQSDGTRLPSDKLFRRAVTGLTNTRADHALAGELPVRVGKNTCKMANCWLEVDERCPPPPSPPALLRNLMCRVSSAPGGICFDHNSDPLGM